MRRPVRCVAALLWILTACGCTRRIAEHGTTTARDETRAQLRPTSSSPPPQEAREEEAARGDEADKATLGESIRPRPERREPDTLGSPLGEAVSRAGARRLEAVWPRDLSVSYEPDPALTWPELRRALGGRLIQGTVEPFARLGARPEEVEHSGEILALAVARQLRQVGWEVLMEGFRIAPTTDGAPGGSLAAGAAKASRLLMARVRGQGSFTVTPGEAAVARIEARVTFALERGGSGAAEVRVERRVAADRSPVRSRRVQLAKKAALAAFVEELFRQSNLQPSLIAAVRKVR